MAKVLIIDDSLFVRTKLQSFFEETMKFEVVGVAEDGNEGLELFQSLSPDLVTMDMCMPNKDGMDALADILQINPDARVLMISANKDKEKVVQAIEIGAKGYIEKPLRLKTPEEIADLVHEVEDALE